MSLEKHYEAAHVACTPYAGGSAVYKGVDAGIAAFLSSLADDPPEAWIEAAARARAEEEGNECFDGTAEFPGEAEVRAMDRMNYTQEARTCLSAALKEVGRPS